MHKRTGIVIIFTALLLSGCTVPFIGKQQSALQVNANPGASVYLNGNHVGQTPFFDDKLKPGEYSVRLLVENDPTKDWQTKVNLAPRIVSVIHKNFGANEAESANYLLQLEPLVNKTAVELSILTIPDNVIVRVDGQPQGFSPVSLKDIKEGEHVIVLSTPGYQELTLNAQTKPGYKLIVSAQLAHAGLIPQSNPATPSAQLVDSPATASATPTVKPTGKVTPKVTSKVTPTPSKKPAAATSIASGSAEIARPYVVIKNPGTGWLRVHSEPAGGTENEVAKVDSGDKYPFIEKNDSGWFKIEYEPGQEGWVSGQYAELLK